MQDRDKKPADDTKVTEDTKKEDIAGNTLSSPLEMLDNATSKTLPIDHDCSATVLNSHPLNSQPGNPQTGNLQPRNSGGQASSISKEVIPGFRILKELGRGAFGVVFKAEDEQLERSVAIKLPLLKDKRLYDKYIIEARNAAKIESAGIVPVLQVGTTESGQPFVVQKMIDGMTLAEVLESNGSLSVLQSVEVTYKLASAIGRAHSAGLVHRDLKPANIIIDGNGDPWIADFGLAVFEEDQKFRHGEIAGTPLYMAPEQLMGRADWLDGRADIWALGVILHVMLTGKHPFEAANFEKLKEQILQRDPRPLNQRSPHIPMDLDFVFRKCCAKSVSDRYSSAHELAAELNEFLSNWTDDAGPGSSHLAQRGPMLAQRRFMGQQTVRDEKRSLVSQVAPHKPHRALWLLPALLLAIVAILGSIFAMPDKWWVKESEPTTIPAIAEDKVVPDVAPIAKAASKLRVSHSGDGTHTSLVAALESAESGATIFIAAGTYRENVVIKRNVELRGEGTEADVKILGSDSSAIRIVDDSNLRLANVTLEAVGSNINTVEIQNGSLEMESCVVNSTSLDCIMVRPGAELRVLGNCAFRSALHPAIYAKQAAVFEVRNSDFLMEAESQSAEEPICGIQIRSCGGIVSGCSFSGVRATGVDWADAEDPAVVSGCKFKDLMRAIVALNCGKLKISDHQVQACKYGVIANACQGVISQTNIVGSGLKNSVGFRSMNSNGLSFSGIGCIDMDVGFEAEASQLVGSNFSLRSNREYGLLLHDNARLSLEDSDILGTKQTGVYISLQSAASLKRCNISGNELTGVWVDSPGDALFADHCQIEANGIGLLLTVGTTQLVAGRVANNRSIGVLVREPVDDAPQEKDGEASPVRLVATDVVFEAVATATSVMANDKLLKAAIYFSTLGEYTLKNCTVTDPSHDNQPLLSAGLKAHETNGLVKVKESSD